MDIVKKNKWQELKKYNDKKELSLKVEDQIYIDKVSLYAMNRGVGLVETEIIKKDLIGMALEAKKEGELLEKRLGDVKIFADNLVEEGKENSKKEKLYYGVWMCGEMYCICAGICLGLIVLGRLITKQSGYVSVPAGLWMLLYPVILWVYQTFLAGRFTMIKSIGRVIDMLLWCLTYLVAIILLQKNTGKIPLSDVAVPDYILLVFIPLAVVIYLYGRKKFGEITEVIAEKYRI